MAPVAKQSQGSRVKGDGGTLKKFMTGGEDPGKNKTKKIIKEICSMRKDMKEELESMRSEIETAKEQLIQKRKARKEESRKKKKRVKTGKGKD